MAIITGSVRCGARAVSRLAWDLAVLETLKIWISSPVEVSGADVVLDFDCERAGWLCGRKGGNLGWGASRLWIMSKLHLEK